MKFRAIYFNQLGSLSTLDRKIWRKKNVRPLKVRRKKLIEQKESGTGKNVTNCN
jgi:hypothetical protein